MIDPHYDKPDCGCPSTPCVHESAAAILHGVLEQSFPSFKIWRDIWRDPELALKCRVVTNRLFSHVAPSTRCKWLALAIQWGDQGIRPNVNASRSALNLALNIINP